MRKLRFAVLAPSHITAADEDECSRYADKEAFSRRTRVESASGRPSSSALSARLFS
jgi:hypothetical protein